jgi:hypothetical protein
MAVKYQIVEMEHVSLRRVEDAVTVQVEILFVSVTLKM